MFRGVEREKLVRYLFAILLTILGATAIDAILTQGQREQKVHFPWVSSLCDERIYFCDCWLRFHQHPDQAGDPGQILHFCILLLCNMDSDISFAIDAVVLICVPHINRRTIKIIYLINL